MKFNSERRTSRIGYKLCGFINVTFKIRGKYVACFLKGFNQTVLACCCFIEREPTASWVMLKARRTKSFPWYEHSLLSLRKIREVLRQTGDVGGGWERGRKILQEQCKFEAVCCTRLFEDGSRLGMKFQTDSPTWNSKYFHFMSFLRKVKFPQIYFLRVAIRLKFWNHRNTFLFYF